MRIKNTIVVLWCLICMAPLSGFTQNNFFTKYDNALSTKKYTEAVLLAEEVYFVQSEPAIKNEALIRKTNAYLALKDYTQALTTLDRVNLIGMSDSFVYQFHLLDASTFYLNNQYENALSELTKIDLMPAPFLHKSETYILQILCNNELYQWKTAASLTDSLFLLALPKTTLNDSIYKQLLLHYSKKQIPKIKSLDKATLLSTLLPGSGQMYVGNFQEGVVNVFLELACAAFIGFTIYKGFYASSVLIGYALLQRFYLGGIHRLEFLTAEKNKSLTINYNQKLKNAILSVNR